MNRKEFLEKAALASAMIWVPKFLKGSSSPSFGAAAEGKVMVVIQLTGGNDGLNTVVPWQNDIYYKVRPKLAHLAADCLRLDDNLALAPGMEGLKNLYDQGELAVVNGVGYPNPNRSHFRSMDIWQSGSSSDQYLQTGWIGRMLDENGPESLPYHAIEADNGLSLALKGMKMNGIALTSPWQFYQNTREPFFNAIAAQQHHEAHEHPSLEYLHKTLVETNQSAQYLHEKSQIYKSKAEYPLNPFSQHLKMIAELIVSGSATKVYYVSLSGFDTHVGQKGKQGRLLKQYSDAVAAFCKDLKENSRFDDTVVMTFSEFGRRVAQNASGGTDHGTASNVFLMGGKLKKPGVFNPLPSLEDLDKGDLKYSVDFRKIYANLLQDWLKTDPIAVLGEDFGTLGIV